MQEAEDLGFVKLGVHPIGVVMLSTGNDEQPLEGTLRRVVHTARVLWRHDGVALTRDEEHRPRSQTQDRRLRRRSFELETVSGAQGVHRQNHRHLKGTGGSQADAKLPPDRSVGIVRDNVRDTPHHCLGADEGAVGDDRSDVCRLDGGV